MVFQSCALYPHMSVEKNIGFGLSMSGCPAAEVSKRVRYAAELLQIEPLLKRAAERVPLYAFSNTNGAHVEHFSVIYAGVLGHFREIFLSSSIGLRKPDAAAYDHVVNAIGVPASRIVFFDDLAENIEGAKARGLTTVHVRSPEDVADALAALGI